MTVSVSFVGVPVSARRVLEAVVVRAAGCELDESDARRTHVIVRGRREATGFTTGTAWMHAPVGHVAAAGRPVLYGVTLRPAVLGGVVFGGLGERREGRHAGHPVSWVAQSALDDFFAVAVHEFAHVSQFARFRRRSGPPQFGRDWRASRRLRFRADEREANAKAALALEVEREWLAELAAGSSVRALGVGAVSGG